MKKPDADQERKTNHILQFVLLIVPWGEHSHRGHSGEATESSMRQRERRELWTRAFIVGSKGKRGQGRVNALNIG